MEQTNCHFYNGIMYRVEYKKELSQLRYTKKRVYHIHTEEKNYPKAMKAIASIIEDMLNVPQGSIPNKGKYQLLNQRAPSIENHLKPYYEFEYDGEKDVYVYTLVKPYDD